MIQQSEINLFLRWKLQDAVKNGDGENSPLSDDDEIKTFIAQRGITICPSQPAAVLGETTPGWRRKVEGRAESTVRSAMRDN